MSIGLTNRPLELDTIVSKALPNPTGEFPSDFLRVLTWCIENSRVAEHHRANFGIPVTKQGLESTKKQLLSLAKTLIGKAGQSWQWLYDHLEDDLSKQLLLNVLAYRSIGWRYVPMPLDSPAFWSEVQRFNETEQTTCSHDRIDAGSLGIKLARFDLTSEDVNIRVYSDSFGIVNEFMYSQYVYRGQEKLLSPHPGDHIVDCGACFGGTSLFFADKVGPKGRVMSFEFFPANINVFRKNMEQNPDQKRRIKLVQAPVWSEDGTTMKIQGSGPATQVQVAPSKSRRLKSFLKQAMKRSNAPSATGSLESTKNFQVVTKTIDTTVAEQGWLSVDMIKMDIEGAELAALRGARATIETHKPTLAICVYHKLADFYEIPQWLDSLGLGYKFYLQHSRVQGDETVLFANARH